MRPRAIRVAGLALTVVYAGFVVWVYATQPRSVDDLQGGMAAALGAYAVEKADFAEGLRFFANDQFIEARLAFARADPAARDARTQFYVAYSYYRQGWGRLAHDDALFRQALAALDRAVSLAPGGRLAVADPTLGLQTADELRAEVERGLTHDWSDANPLGWLQPRK
jgi:hypothetical protein